MKKTEENNDLLTTAVAGQALYQNPKTNEFKWIFPNEEHKEENKGFKALRWEVDIPVEQVAGSTLSNTEKGKYIYKLHNALGEIPGKLSDFLVNEIDTIRSQEDAPLYLDTVGVNLMFKGFAIYVRELQSRYFNLKGYPFSPELMLQILQDVQAELNHMIFLAKREADEKNKINGAKMTNITFGEFNGKED